MIYILKIFRYNFFVINIFILFIIIKIEKREKEEKFILFFDLICR